MNQLILKMKTQQRSLSRLAVIAMALTLAACGGDDDNGGGSGGDGGDGSGMETQLSYRISVTNATYNQPLSPIAVVLHEEDYIAWEIGSSASESLEELAESGSPAAFLEDNPHAYNSARGEDILMPGNTEEIEISFTTEEQAANVNLTVATMLVNTNDAFAGVTGWNLADLSVGQSMKLLAPVYDAGTEENSETAASIPGPAGGGEGSNAMREAHDFVTRHPGVVTKADGYMASALDQSHRFDNGAAVIRVERIQ